MIEKNLKTVGIGQMHPMQVTALMEVIENTMRLAIMTDDDDIIEEVTHHVNNMIQLFGGLGVKVDCLED